MIISNNVKIILQGLYYFVDFQVPDAPPPRLAFSAIMINHLPIPSLFLLLILSMPKIQNFQPFIWYYSSEQHLLTILSLFGDICLFLQFSKWKSAEPNLSPPLPLQLPARNTPTHFLTDKFTPKKSCKGVISFWLKSQITSRASNIPLKLFFY